MATATFDRMTRMTQATRQVEVAPATARNVTEEKGPDGIRHELVARIREQIAKGTYDTEEKWLLAEEALLRRIEE